MKLYLYDAMKSICGKFFQKLYLKYKKKMMEFSQI